MAFACQASGLTLTMARPGWTIQPFWEAVAKAFANHPTVLFDLYNEPHDVSWQVWRNGGMVSEKRRVADPFSLRISYLPALSLPFQIEPGLSRITVS